jgi:2-aminoadipate transaminase
MLNALERYFPEGVRWTRPAGGLFLWVILPEHLNTTELLAEAIAERVAFVPGAPFHPDGSGQNTMRLNFSYMPPEKIEEGIKRLGRVLERALSQHVTLASR